MKKIIFLFLWLLPFFLRAQRETYHFRVRTITAGVSLSGLTDTAAVLRAIDFLKEARKEFAARGYEVQTLRVATSNLYTFLGNRSLYDALPSLERFDQIAQRSGVILSVGQVLSPDGYSTGMAAWAEELVRRTKTISFSLAISSHLLGIHTHSIRQAAENIQALSKVDGGEANFRFTASANCPAGIPELRPGCFDTPVLVRNLRLRARLSRRHFMRVGTVLRSGWNRPAWWRRRLRIWGRRVV